MLGGGKLDDDVGAAVQIEDLAIGEHLLAVGGGFEGERLDAFFERYADPEDNVWKGGGSKAKRPTE